jgi:hypothetical protein
VTKTLDRAMPKRLQLPRPPQKLMRSKDQIIDEICAQLEPLKTGADMDIVAKEIRRRLQREAPKMHSRLMGVTNATAIKKAAKEFRDKFHSFKASKHKVRFADLLKESAPGVFEIIDGQLEAMVHIDGPDSRFESSEHLSVTLALGLLKEYSRPPIRKARLCGIARLIHRYRTGEWKPLKNACDAVWSGRHPLIVSRGYFTLGEGGF